MTRNERQSKQQITTLRYRNAVRAVQGGIPSILLRPEVVEAWSWILLRCSLDISENQPNRILQDLRDDAAVVGLVSRIGARLALPEGYAESAAQPKVAFWKSHVTGLELPNPFATDDKTDQIFVEQHLGKEFAAELRIAAEGGRSYRDEFERGAQARLAAVIQDFPADGFNPHVELFPSGDMSPPAIEFRTKAMLEIQRLERENPPLNEWLKTVARPLYVNPYESIGHNMTRQTAVLKADGDFARLLDRAATFKRLQLTDEVEEANRVAAEAQHEAASADAKANLESRRVRFGR